MEAIAILWNSMEDNFVQAISDIQKFAKINEIIRIDFKESFIDFISDIYPYENNDLWKLNYKIEAMNNKYNKNEIVILFLNLPNSQKKFVPRKNLFIYENIENLKKFIRDKYKNFVKNYRFDNIFHMTDNDIEYNKTLLIIKKHLIKNMLEINSTNGFVNLNQYLISNVEMLEKNETNGKRNKFWFVNNQFMYKESKKNTYETYSEIFVSELANCLNLNSANYIPTLYNDKEGVVTINFIEKNEILVDGTNLINDYIKQKRLTNEFIEMKEICKFNNLEYILLIIKDYCLKNELLFDDRIVENLKKIFVFDIILLQTDRNPNNWGLVINQETRMVNIAPLYDSANIMCINKGFDLNYKLSDMYMFPTMLLFDSKDNIFDNTINMLERINDEDIMSIFNDMYEKIGNLNFNTFFDNLENKYRITFPQNFKLYVEMIIKQNIKTINDTFISKKKIKIKKI